MQHSFTEENYLKIIHTLSGKDGLEVSTSAIAESTATKAASVTDMLKKLAEKGFIHYKRYQGVTLTPMGENLALKVIRKHRLWEAFLVDKLGFGWDEVHEIAEELEHISSDLLVERLDAYLNYPRFDPHGDPIPDAKGNMPEPGYVMLSELKKGQKATLTGVLDHSQAFLQYLDSADLNLGTGLEVLDINAYDHSYLLQIDNGKNCFVSSQVARHLLVQP
ncbi:metal-dependent transcriptional regulator [Ravibacter arvi]|uniref:Transcriptional regulator MntR n=1 Tax=Ravibacter arvi TaxID=2051041 RepID=A0ABP8LR26_9BACT